MKWIIAVLVLLVAGCQQETYTSPPPKEGDVIEVPAFTWYVVSQAEMETRYLLAGQVIQPGEQLQGFAGQLGDGSWVVFTRAPTQVDDRVTTTLGHEVIHLVRGKYHH